VTTKNFELSRLGRRIRRARKLLGLSQEGLATKCRIDRSYLAGLERGECEVTFDVLCLICDGLDCDIAAMTKEIPYTIDSSRSWYDGAITEKKNGSNGS
jgi:transcriptional regulator with XRE-family HTH domain